MNEVAIPPQQQIDFKWLKIRQYGKGLTSRRGMVHEYR